MNISTLSWPVLFCQFTADLEGTRLPWEPLVILTCLSSDCSDSCFLKYSGIFVSISETLNSGPESRGGTIHFLWTHFTTISESVCGSEWWEFLSLWFGWLSCFSPRSFHIGVLKPEMEMYSLLKTMQVCDWGNNFYSLFYNYFLILS